MGQRLQIEWHETTEQLQLFYGWEHNPHRKMRLQALWHLRCGKRLQEVADIIGVCYRTLQYWVAWYRVGGLAEVLRHIPGQGSGPTAKLTPIRQRALAAKVALGVFRTVWDAIQWVTDRWGIMYTYSGLHACLQRLRCAPKVPRPQSVKANPKRQRWWKEQGLRDALQEASLQPEDQVWFCDEMRFGLWGQVRKRWGLRGVKIIQKVQIEFAWEYLVLAVDVFRCELRWDWAKRMNQTHLLPIFKRWLPDAVIWDGASAHGGKAMGEVGFERISLPPYSPELNPCERVFEWLRGQIEGEVYASLQHKRRVIDQLLRRLNADKGLLNALIGWQWIQEAFAPACDP
ncbi:MAG: IS630 family transposase [Acidobacteria bacterium]|nr:IS630 family transposase [Acidobacteriota bacterium]